MSATSKRRRRIMRRADAAHLIGMNDARRMLNLADRAPTPTLYNPPKDHVSVRQEYQRGWEKVI